MWSKVWQSFVVAITLVAAAFSESDKEFFERINTTTKSKAQVVVKREWDYKTSLSDEKAAELKNAKEDFFKHRKTVKDELLAHDEKNYDASLKRQSKFFKQIDAGALEETDRKRFFDLINNMVRVYSEAKVKEFQSSSQTKTLDGDAVSKEFRDNYGKKGMAPKLSFYWKEWHEAIGNNVKKDFENYVELANKIAKENGFTNNAERWKDTYEVPDFEEKIKNLWEKIKPLHKQVHAYVRRKLHDIHGSDVVDIKGPIPASLLGNIWGMDGINIYSIVIPDSNLPTVNATPQLKAQGYDGEKMARKAQEFFTSIGLSEMTQKFWAESILKKPDGRNIDCAQESFNFYDENDYRIKYCATPSLEDWGGIHHEMGKIENYMAWKGHPYIFQLNQNPGFNDVIGEVVNMFVTSPTHLKSINLLESYWTDSNEQQLNYLMQQALYIILFIPYAYTLDLWRWKVFRGEVNPKDYNCEFWNTRIDLQGVEPPVERFDHNFDAGAKHQIIDDKPAIKFFLNVILQYQWHKALCLAAGKYDRNDPAKKKLYLCDISGSKVAGDKLKKGIQYGSSETWDKALKEITGQTEIDVQPLLDFFKPLHDWLKTKNANEFIGWEKSKKKFCSNPGSGAGTH